MASRPYILLLLFFSNGCFAMKRRAPNRNEERNGKLRRVEPQYPVQHVLENNVLNLFPPELLGLIGTFLVGEYPLRPLDKLHISEEDVFNFIRINPLGYLFCVSKAWLIAMNSEPFKYVFLHTPNRAHPLYYLRQCSKFYPGGAIGFSSGNTSS